jgi:excisionase family DNA binding protein
MPTELKAKPMTDNIAAILAHPTLTPEQLCHVLGLGKQVVYRALQSGSIPSFRPGREFRTPTAWVREQLGIPQPA